MTKVSISHLTNAHTDWLRALDFYKQELGILRARLTEIAGKNTDAEVLKQVEHFENQFTIQADNINVLSHDIRANLTAIAAEANTAGAGYIHGALVDQHTALGSRFETEQKIINELRQAFNQFAAMWM